MTIIRLLFSLFAALVGTAASVAALVLLAVLSLRPWIADAGGLGGSSAIDLALAAAAAMALARITGTATERFAGNAASRLRSDAA